MADRDRDEAGRARNARPRDASGRPLPRRATGVTRPDEEEDLTPDEAFARAQALLDDDRPFDAHDVLEGRWKAAPEEEKLLWKGLAQLAVGLTHEQRGNARGASALLRRGAATVSEAPDAAARYGVDPTALSGWATAREASGPSAPGLVLRT
ncbi:hypothetical protein Acsp06_48050 [Actinomycetospora sp. NBRC 106375]|uniref:DUF309 domain-containing protein n=1 Tax=Actinomycetospora sp. NBRC 106375 TaxID=3032207 RepID=UPI0024A1BBAC|nr:DUF309 domain-containing protein [Actinomycetospora sp. NBRC 106375]GLZ48620.1 hypothetical protein Acsp06_48050 [Actinomycetospora sp. NBRC 106375]